MGYSIAVKVRNEQLHKKMLDFMKKNFTDWSKLSGQEFDYVRGPISGENTDEGMSYIHGRLKIGFDYGAPDPMERHYAHCVIRWMSLKVECKKRGKNYWLYDSQMNVIMDGKDACDEFGWKEPSGFDHTTNKEIGLIKNELKRLNSLWEAQ